MILQYEARCIIMNSSIVQTYLFQTKLGEKQNSRDSPPM